VEFLRESAYKKMEVQATAEPTSDLGKVAPLARWYGEMRSAAAKALLTAECSAIRAMADTLPRSLAGKTRRRTPTPKKQKGS
jgi:ABC-type phosphonate transport system ATPase subunit